MNMPIVIVLAAAILLYIITFFQRDRVKLVEKDIEDLTIQFHQETYQMKKRMKILEEELLENSLPLPFNHTRPSKGRVNEILRNQVIALHQQGINTEQISRQSSLPVSEVKQIILEIQKSSTI